MPFTPKFVDLVRNLTSVQGTGPVTLGAAVAGYTSFAAATVAGEQFYYCIQGVDKPAEREVGRGTMQANGTIAREAIGGAATNFTAGTKTIALVAAAEWFSRLDQVGPAPAPFDVGTRGGLAATSLAGARPAFLAEGGREGLFVFDAGDLSAKVAADPLQAVFVAPASAPNGASGAWVRQYREIEPEWFGAVGNGVADDSGAFSAMRTLCSALGVNAGIGLKGGPPIRLGLKTYYLADHFDWKGCSNAWHGTSTGLAHFWEGSGSTIKLAVGKTFRLNRADTENGLTGTAISAFGGDATEFHNIVFRGGGKGVGTAPVFWARSRPIFHNCRFIDGGGHGLEISATAGGAAAVSGNANGWLMIGGACSGNGKSGLYTFGADANAGTAIGVSFDNNSEYGTLEESFLGNRYLGCHWDSNLLGHVRGTGANNTSIFDGYFESGYPISVLPARSYATGTMGDQINGARLEAGSGILTANGGIRTTRVDGAKTIEVSRGSSAADPTIDAASFTDFCGGVTPFVSRFRTGVDEIVWGLGTTSAAIALAFNGNGAAGLTRRNHGLTTAPSGVFAFRELYLGDGSFPDGRALRCMTAAPAAGEHARGEFTFNKNAGAGDAFAWQVTATGTPGTHTPLYSALNKVGVGYVTGAGGAVTQATDKATGVTLDKICGAITLNGAALAANAAVSFTLTNNQIAATDVVHVSIKSGATAGAYAVSVDAIAAGSCRISFRNLSAGSLSEAPVLNFAVVKAVAA